MPFVTTLVWSQVTLYKCPSPHSDATYCQLLCPHYYYSSWHSFYHPTKSSRAWSYHSGFHDKLTLVHSEIQA